MQCWDYCAICGRKILVGEMCYGIKESVNDFDSNTICKDCITIENIPEDAESSLKTNGDCIRAMSDEELAKEFVLAGEFENRVCFYCEYFKCLQNKDGYCVYKHGRCNMDARLEAYKKWLQQPAEE